MKKELLSCLLLLCAVLLCVSCKVVGPLAKDATFYQWRWNQIHVDPENVNNTGYGANFIYTGESLSRDTVVIYLEEFTRLSDNGLMTYHPTIVTQRLIHDVFMKDGHTYVTGEILTINRTYDDWDGSCYRSCTADSIQYPFLEIDGVIKDITPKDPRVKENHKLSGILFYHDGKKLYTIIRDYSFEMKELPQGQSRLYNHYVSEDSAEPYFIGSFEEFWKVTNIGKVGDEWYVVGSWSGNAYYQSSSESKMTIAPPTSKGTVNDVVSYQKKPLMVGRIDGLPITYSNDSISYLPGPEEFLEDGDAIFAKTIGKDLYIGGRLGHYPVIWKNNKLYIVLKKLPKGFKYLFFTDIEVVGDMIYVVGEGEYPSSSSTHTAFFKLKDNGERIEEYDEYEDLETSVDVMKWIGNTEWRNVSYDPDEDILFWHINKPRVLLKY